MDYDMALPGTLVRYGSAGPQVALLCGPASASRALILIGGLTDGLLYAPYVVPMTKEMTARGWMVVHASLQSSWTGYGTGSLDRDADDLAALAAHLGARAGVRSVALLGHSTGCQDIVRYVARHGPGARQAAARGDGTAAAYPDLLATVLQAPVSDHEWLSSYPELTHTAEAARALVAGGQGDSVVGHMQVADGAPITASRFLSLYELGGDDDMFSQGLPAEKVKAILAPLSQRPCLLLVSGADECVPADQQHDIVRRAQALRELAGAGVRLAVVGGAPHNLAGCEAEAVRLVCEFLDAAVVERAVQ